MENPEPIIIIENANKKSLGEKNQRWKKKVTLVLATESINYPLNSYLGFYNILRKSDALL